MAQSACTYPANASANPRGRVRYEPGPVSDRKRAFDDNTNGLIDRYVKNFSSPSLPTPAVLEPIRPIRGSQPVSGGAVYGWYANNGTLIEPEYRSIASNFFNTLNGLVNSVNSLIATGVDLMQIQVTIQVQQQIFPGNYAASIRNLQDQIPKVYRNIGNELINLGVPSGVVRNMQAGSLLNIVTSDQVVSPFSYQITT